MLFNIEKAAVVAEFQKETEEALARADFVTTNDLTVLQAYVLSLVSANGCFNILNLQTQEIELYLTASSLLHGPKTRAEGFGPC